MHGLWRRIVFSILISIPTIICAITAFLGIRRMAAVPAYDLNPVPTDQTARPADGHRS